jgi:hypothetical protein
MKKIVFALIFFLLLFYPKPIYGQIPVFTDIEKMMPGVGCGVALEKGIDKCCSAPTVNCPRLPLQTVLEAIPYIGGKIKDYYEKCQALVDFQNQYTNIPCVFGKPSSSNSADPNCKCESDATATASPQIAMMCYKYLSNSKEIDKCLSCSVGGIWTAIGCVPLNLASFVNNYLLPLGIGLGGLIALLCIVFSAISLQTSTGNPEKIKKAQENLTACILGLILIIFSIFILRLIGVDILRIPGFK